jgi:hypothetical protein
MKFTFRPVSPAVDPPFRISPGGESPPNQLRRTETHVVLHVVSYSGLMSTETGTLHKFE